MQLDVNVAYWRNTTHVAVAYLGYIVKRRSEHFQISFTFVVERY